MAYCPEPIEDVQKELTCSICQELYTNPVTIECSHSFCHCCLLRTCQEASTPFQCPECGRISHSGNFKADVSLGKLVAIAKNLNSHGFQIPEGHGKREVCHKLELFCEDEQSPVCTSCSQSQKHQGHRLCSTEEAAEKFRGKLQETLTALWKKSGDIEQQIGKEKLQLALIEKEIEIQKNSTDSEIQKIIRFLREEEDAYVSGLQTTGIAILEALSKRMNILSSQQQELMDRITELEEKCEQPDLDLLKDMNRVLRRNQFVLQRETETFPMSIPIQEFPDIIDWISNFKVDVTFDCSTADPGLIISEDLKSVTYGGVQEEHDDRGLFMNFAQVLGTQSFDSGRYYWEVKVPNNTPWCVGLRKEPRESQDFFVLKSVHIMNSNYHLYALAQHNLYSQFHRKYRQPSVSNLIVGIFLNYERGEISFYHVKKRYLIYTFPTTSFLGGLLPFFCLHKTVLTNDCSLTICP